MHSNNSLSSIRGLHCRAEKILSLLSCICVRLCVCYGCMCVTYPTQNGTPLNYRPSPKIPKNGREICLLVTSHSINWRFFKRRKGDNEILSTLLHQWHHHTSLHYTLTNITEFFDAALLWLFELQEPVNFAAHEFHLICELELTSENIIILLYIMSPRAVFTHILQFPWAWPKEEKKKKNWYQSAFIEHCKANKINSERVSTKGISKCKTLKSNKIQNRLEPG